MTAKARLAGRSRSGTRSVGPGIGLGDVDRVVTRPCSGVPKAGVDSELCLWQVWSRDDRDPVDISRPKPGPTLSAAGTGPGQAALPPPARLGNRANHSSDS